MKAPRSNHLALLCSLLVLLAFIFYYAGSNIFAQKTKEKLQSAKIKLESDISYTNKLLNETKKSKLISMNQLLILNNKIGQREDLISTVNTEIDGVDGQIASSISETASLNAQLKQLKEDYAKMIVYAYKNRSACARLMYVFASSDINQAYVRLKYLQQYTDYRKKQSEQITETAHDLSAKIAELKAIKSGKTVLLQNEEDEKTLLAQEKTEKNEAVKKLSLKEAELLKTIKDKEKEAVKLQQSITAVIADEIKKAAEKTKKKTSKTNNTTTTTTATTTTTTPETTTTTPTVKVSTTSKELGLSDADITLSNSFAANLGKLPWPTEKGVVTSTFGVHPHPVLTEVKVKNNGIDISTSQGSKARAVFDGKVTGIVSIPGANKAVIVRHGEYLTVYSNLTDVYVTTGEAVKTKQSIGLIYTDTDESKTELHFEVWFGKVLTDPLNWLSPTK